MEHVGQSLVVENPNEEVKTKVLEYQESLNTDEKVYDQLRSETDAVVLGCLLWEWLDHLKVRLVGVWSSKAQ